MKKLLEQVGIAIIALTSIIVLGLLAPMLVSTFIVLTTSYTLEMCTTAVIFWIFTIIFWLTAGIYVNDAITNE